LLFRYDELHFLKQIDIEYLTSCRVKGITYNKTAIELDEDTNITNDRLKRMKNEMERPDSRCTIMIIAFKVVFRYENIETRSHGGQIQNVYNNRLLIAPPTIRSQSPDK
jgi:hypothetical protein